ncbi:MAG TPA: DMT family transporter [Candidatus Limnocylindrales bacterium]|nr:DMT family transporter [Candidatus Limnocylindrales bacterium]
MTPSSTSSRSSSAASVADLLAAAALWGGMYVVSAGTFSRIPPVTLGLLRLVVGVAVLALVLRFRLGLGRSELPRIVAAGAIVALTLVLQFVGTGLTGGAEGALLTTTTPAFVLLFGATLERERVHPAAWLGVAIALAGVAVVAGRNVTGAAVESEVAGLPSRLVGDGLLVGSAATWALYSSVGRPLVHAVGAVRAILGSSAVAILLVAPLVPVELASATIPPLDPPAIAAVAYLGVGATAVAWSLWYRGYAAAPPAVSAAAFFAQPVVGAALGALALGEPIDPPFVAGALLIGAGTVALVVPDVRRASATLESP